MKILLVIDIQEKYLQYYDSELLAGVNRKISEAGAANTPVFYMRNIGRPEYDDIYKFAPGLLIVSEHIYEKKSPSAFSNEIFVNDIKKMEVNYIEVIGIDANCCVKKTCIDAADAGYMVTVDTACLRARSPKILEKTLKELKEKGIKIA